MIRVLIIDDNEDITFSVKYTLEELDEDMTVLRAHSGKEGMSILKKKKVDLILLDIMMPDMNGWIVNKELKKNNKTKEIPVIFLTAKTDKTSRDMGKNGGAAYMTKPFEPEELSRMILKTLKKRKKNS